MTEARDRLHLKVRDKPIMREVMLDSEQPVVGILKLARGRVRFRANLKRMYLIRDDGVEEQPY